MKIISIIVNTVFLTIIVAVALLFLVPLLPIDHSLEMRIVESGSMEPSITTGSLVMILPKESYGTGDVITFKSATADVPTTHRIIDTYTENGRSWFITKGDANEEADTAAVASGDIIGTVRFSVPRAGFLLDFARTPTGFLLLIVLPSVLLIFGEIEKIWKELRKRKSPIKMEGDTDEVKPVAINNPDSSSIRPRVMADIFKPVKHTAYPTLDLAGTVSIHSVNQLVRSLTPVTVVVLLCIMIICSSFFGSTVSYFNDQESSTGNTFVAIELDFDVFPDGSSFVFDDGELVGDIDGALVSVVTQTASSADTQYDITTEFQSGSFAFCDAIIASSTQPFVYGGPLTSLSASDVEFPAPWSLMFALSDSASTSVTDTCQIDIVLTAWHYEESSNQGYFDEERIPLMFSQVVPVGLQHTVSQSEQQAFASRVATIVSTTTPTTTASTTNNGGGNDNGNNGHGNEGDGNDDSNPGGSNDPLDHTDDEEATSTATTTDDTASSTEKSATSSAQLPPEPEVKSASTTTESEEDEEQKEEEVVPDEEEEETEEIIEEEDVLEEETEEIVEEEEEEVPEDPVEEETSPAETE